MHTDYFAVLFAITVDMIYFQESISCFAAAYAFNTIMVQNPSAITMPFAFTQLSVNVIAGPTSHRLSSSQVTTAGYALIIQPAGAVPSHYN